MMSPLMSAVGRAWARGHRCEPWPARVQQCLHSLASWIAPALLATALATGVQAAERLRGVSSWGYQLQHTAPTEIAAQAAGRPVLVVEYLDSPELRDTADAVLRSRGMIPYIGTRKLDRLVMPRLAPGSPTHESKP